VQITPGRPNATRDDNRTMRAAFLQLFGISHAQATTAFCFGLESTSVQTLEEMQF
jgi:hypothetical protein